MENLNRTITREVVELVTKKDIHKVRRITFQHLLLL